MLRTRELFGGLIALGIAVAQSPEALSQSGGRDLNELQRLLEERDKPQWRTLPDNSVVLGSGPGDHRSAPRRSAARGS